LDHEEEELIEEDEIMNTDEKSEMMKMKAMDEAVK